MVLAVLVGLAGATVVLLRDSPRTPPAVGVVSSSSPVTARGELAATEMTTIEIFERASPAVVYITTLERRRSGRLSFNVHDIPKGTGSGFVWDDRGHVVTNFHVVAEGNAFRVTLADQSSFEATLIGAEPSKDLAVLRVKGAGLPPLPIGTSADLRVGQSVYAIGNPFGLDHTLTTGVVSALGREIKAANGRTIGDVVQTDAAINPGNSGGPLLDSAGRLIGVNTAIYSPSGGSSGIGFAVPVDTVRRVVPQLIEFGRVIRPGLGVSLVADATQRRLGLAGPMIASVQPGSPAAHAGLRGPSEGRLGRIVMGDVVTHVDGKRTPTADALLGVLEDSEVGEAVEVTVRRGGSQRTVTVVLTQLQ